MGLKPDHPSENFEKDPQGTPSADAGPSHLLADSGYLSPAKPDTYNDTIVRQAFGIGYAASFSPSELVQAGIVHQSYQIFDGPQRNPSDVKQLVLTSSADRKEGDPLPNYRVLADGTIEQLRDPDRGLTSGDKSVIIELDNGAPGKPLNPPQAQRQAFEELLNYTQGRYQGAQMPQAFPADLAFAGTRSVPPPSLTDQVPPAIGQWPPPLPLLTPETLVPPPPAPDSSKSALPEQLTNPDISTRDQFKGFVDHVVNTIAASEGNFTTITWRDGNGKMAIGKGQFNQAGEMPDLMWAWYRKDPEKFKHIFGRHYKQMLDSDFITDAQIVKGSDIAKSIQKALADEEFQKVQTDLLRDKVVKAFALASKYGHTSDRFVAQVADMANQFGWGGVEHCLRNCGCKHIKSEHTAIDRLKHTGVRYVGEQYAKNRQARDKRISNEFSESEHTIHKSDMG